MNILNCVMNRLTELWISSSSSQGITLVTRGKRRWWNIDSSCPDSTTEDGSTACGVVGSELQWLGALRGDKDQEGRQVRGYSDILGYSGTFEGNTGQPPLQLNTAARDWYSLFLWSPPIASNEVMQTVTVESDTVFDLKTAHMSVRSIIMQCGLSEGKQNWP